ncbi:MAG: hypothetical protein IAG13_27715, partial [Deltaproteobacteria bacterium]|nr:hypothetical protein [Nannocystaceae bacterium]
TRLDLRPIARALAEGRVGALEAYHDALLLRSRPLGAGRAGRRLGMLVEVVRRMIIIAREDAEASDAEVDHRAFVTRVGT